MTGPLALQLLRLLLALLCVVSVSSLLSGGASRRLAARDHLPSQCDIELRADALLGDSGVAAKACDDAAVDLGGGVIWSSGFAASLGASWLQAGLAGLDWLRPTQRERGVLRARGPPSSEA